MILVDNALKAREEQGKPVRVAMVGAGFMGQGLTNQIMNSIPGMRMVAVYNRNLKRAVHVYEYAGLKDIAVATTQQELDNAIYAGKPVVTEDPFLLARSEQVDILIDVTGSVEFGALIVLEAFKHGKDVVLMNAEIDATIGPILQVYAEKYGVIMSACDGDEPGAQMNLYRWGERVGFDSSSHRKYQGAPGSISEPDNSAGIRRAMGPESRDGNELCGWHEDQLRTSHRGECDRICCEIQRDV